MSDALPLPPRPHLEQYKKLAKDLQHACRSDDPIAIRSWAGTWLETLARLEGRSFPPADRERAAKRMEQRWDKLSESAQQPESCPLARAQFFIAREHGFASWIQFSRHVEDLTRAHSSVSTFEAAADAIVNGNAATLKPLLVQHPELATERSTRDHRSTLLHYISANGIEDFRQRTPANIIEIAHLLLDAGADINAESDAYGGGCTALGLIATSVHPEKAGVQIPLLRALVERGATFQQPSAGGNRQPIVQACLANGRLEAARFFADLGASLDLASAAALGRMEAVRKHFEGRASLPEAKQAEAALLYACGFGSYQAAKFLLDHGVDPAARNPQGETALHWANYGPHPDVIRLLLDRKAPVHLKDHQFHATPLDVALWCWSKASDPDERDRCYTAVGLLAKAGAKLDPDQWRDDEQEQSGMLARIESDLRMRAALEGESSP